jgi:alginate O-acetyltransferase complex protein AlgI
MVFSSPLFLYVFIPVFFSLYWLAPERFRNPLILGGSLLFYAVGAGSTVAVLAVSIWLNQFLGMRMSRASGRRRKLLLIVGVALDLLGIAYYKYLTFLWGLANDTAVAGGFWALPDPPDMPLPVGISFFTFQAISYLVDIYRGEIPPAAGYSEFATYHSLFPQLVAGPIVRYREIREEMHGRRIDLAAVAEGTYRFCLGLGKKVILADNLGTVADAAFAAPPGGLGFVQAWLGIICYSLQIYFDFSGYSDMAIGLGRLLGFHFPENFDQPYRSANITEFWRRWHMTLSRWFRDYLYIPLGGNRRGILRTSINLWLVFFLCGLWHGAGLTFIAWGLYHGLMLSLERVTRNRFGWQPFGWASIPVTFVLVTIGWVFFRAPTLGMALQFLGAMFFISDNAAVVQSPFMFLPRETVCYLAAGLFFAFVPFEPLSRLRLDGPIILLPQLGFSIICLAYASLLLAANSFNPFIYFRF